MVFATVTVGPKGQIVLPKIFRDSYGLQPGSRVVIEEKNNELVVRKPASDIVKFFREVAKSIGRREPVDMDALYDEEMEEHLKHVLPGRKRFRKRGSQ